jgi:hypothetical protein
LCEFQAAPILRAALVIGRFGVSLRMLVPKLERLAFALRILAAEG